MRFFKILFFVAVIIGAPGRGENPRACSKENEFLINSEGVGEFLLTFLRRFNWGDVVILSEELSGDIIKQFSRNFSSVAVRPACNSDFETLTRFRSVVVTTDHPRKVLANLIEMLRRSHAIPQNWLIITTEDLIDTLPSLFIPLDFKVVVAVTRYKKEIKLLRVYSKELDVLGTVTLGYWRTREKILSAKLVSIPVPSLAGKALRITSITFPPHFHPDYLMPPGDRKPFGIYGEILYVLKGRMNFTYTVEAPHDGTFGIKVNDSSGTNFTGMVGRLLSNVSDVIVALSMTADRVKAIDFSHMVSKFVVKFIFRNRENIEWRFFFFREPFSPYLWISINVLAVIVAILLLITNEITLKRTKSRSPTVQYSRFRAFMWYILVSLYTLLRTGLNYRVSGTPAKIVMQVFHLFCFIMYINYSTVLTSRLTVNVKTVPFRSVVDVLDKSDYNFASLFGTSGTVIYSSAKSGVNMRVWQNIQTNPGRHLTNTLQEGKDLVYSERCVFLMDEIVLAILIRRNCSFEFGEGKAYEDYFTFAYRKGYRYKQMFDKYLKLMVESGIVAKIKEKYMPPNHNQACLLEERKQGLQKHSLIGLFAIIAFGIILSLFILWLEIAYEYFFLP